MSESVNNQVEEQASQQTGKKVVRVRVDQRDMQTSYANSFRPIPSQEEIFLDFGINQTFPVENPQEGQHDTEIVFNASNRIIMNHYTAKRLAMALNQVVGQYENKFGEIKLNPADRQVNQ